MVIILVATLIARAGCTARFGFCSFQLFLNFLRVRSSEVEVIVFPREHLTMSRDIFGCCNHGVGVRLLNWHLAGRGVLEVLGDIHNVQDSPHVTKDYPAPDVNCVKVEKSCSRNLLQTCSGLIFKNLDSKRNTTLGHSCGSFSFSERH